MKFASIATFFVLFATAVFAQKVEDQPVQFNYIQLPETPLDAKVTGYQGIIVQNHEQRVAEMQAATEQERQQADYDYQQALAAWETAKAEVDRQYEEEMAAYNAKSAGNKILEQAFLNETKPVKKPYPMMPRKRMVEEPYYPKVYSSSSLATYASVEGMNKNTGNDVIITILMDGFEIGGVEDRMNVSERKNKDGSVTKVYTYWKDVSFKHGMAVRVESPVNGIIMDEYINEFSNFATRATTQYNNKGDLDRYWMANQNSFLNQLDDEVTMAHLKFIKEMLDNRYGFLTMTRNTEIRTVKQKKFDYSDVQTAYETALAGYNSIQSGGLDKTEAKGQLAKACEAWETVVAEYDPNVKKARIDEKIEMAMRLNLMEAYIFLDEYEKAKMHYNKIMANGKNRDKKDAGALNSFLEDQKMRFMANNPQ